MFNPQLSNQTIVNQGSTDIHSNCKVQSSASFLGTSANIMAIKWTLKCLVKSLYKKHKHGQVVDSKSRFNKEKLHHQMREEGFWKKYAGNEDG
ncbi:hypothetical protein BC833DRAFT_586219 [Globomyces pollinis-pini]|nr:hypothetical protein BC833DRAFT_586219 [Globomyces pollinis-pini]